MFLRLGIYFILELLSLSFGIEVRKIFLAINSKIKWIYDQGGVKKVCMTWN